MYSVWSLEGDPSENVLSESYVACRPTSQNAEEGLNLY
uniref:Uncharacterized protein n=1 Tax=Anguilla anguilla TaxID=7936 RepID=A0A0E9VBF2_ANGAN